MESVTSNPGPVKAAHWRPQSVEKFAGKAVNRVPHSMFFAVVAGTVGLLLLGLAMGTVCNRYTMVGENIRISGSP